MMNSKMFHPGKMIFCSLALGGFLWLDSVHAEEPVTETATIKMVLKNTQVKVIRQAKGEVVSVKLTEDQKKLIRLKSPSFKGETIRISTAYLKKGSNKISVLILKPSSFTPILRIVHPSKSESPRND